MKHYVNFYAMLENLAFIANSKSNLEKIKQQGLKGATAIAECRTIGIFTPRQSGGTSAALEWYRNNPDNTLLVFKEESQARTASIKFNKTANGAELRLSLSTAGMSVGEITDCIRTFQEAQPEPARLNHVLLDTVKADINTKDFYTRMHELFLSKDEIDELDFEEKITKARQTMSLTSTSFVDDKSLTNREFYQKFFIEEAEEAHPERKGIKYIIVDESTTVFAYLGIKRKDFNQWVFDNFGEEALVIHID